MFNKTKVDFELSECIKYPIVNNEQTIEKRRELRYGMGNFKIGKTVLIIISVLALASITLNIVLISNQNAIDGDAIYCKTETSPSDKIEIYYDFKDGSVYKYTIVITSPIQEALDKEKQAEFIAALNSQYKGLSSKVWYDDDSYTTIETFYLDLLTEDEMKHLTGLSIKDLKNQSREELKNSIIAFSGKDHSCH